MTYIVMTPRQLEHLKAAVRAISHAAALMETHCANGGQETPLYSQVVKDANVTMEEIRLVLDLEDITRGPRRLLPPS